MDYLPQAVARPDDINARSQLSWCSAIALSGMINSGRGGAFPLHAMEHALSGHYDISHGRGLAILLPRLMFFTLPGRPSKFETMAVELFGAKPDEPPKQLWRKAIEGTVDFLKGVDRYITLPDVGITDDSKFGVMADDTLRIYSGNGEFLNNPKPLYRKDIIKIFEMCQAPLSLEDIQWL